MMKALLAILCLSMSACSVLRPNGEEVKFRDLETKEKTVLIAWYLVGAVALYAIVNELSSKDRLCTGDGCGSNGSGDPQIPCFFGRDSFGRPCFN